MIGWLLDLIFSNFWLFIILFWVFGSLSKKGKQAKPKTPTVRRQVTPVPRQMNWETDFEPVIPKKSKETDSRALTPVEKKQVERQQSAEKKHVKTPTKAPIEMIPPVQGMIWSQIYGPPRSKQPHRRLKR